jgi:hypothetical protein
VPTLLTTARMSPELAARVEASVRGTGKKPSAGHRPRRALLIRGGALALGVTLVGAIVLVRGRAQTELEQARSELLTFVQERAARITSADRERLTRARTWLEQSARGHAADSISPELRKPGALEERLRRPTVYVRAPVDAVRTPGGLEESAALSGQDAFVLCLNAPPAARTEKALTQRARIAYGGGQSFRKHTGHVERMHSPLAVTARLDAGWTEALAAAESRRILTSLRREWERVPFDAAQRALAARQLLFVLDEASTQRGPTELDGERPHAVRVGLVDLERNELLLSVRGHVDPSWLSDAARAEYARGIDSCALALDVREAVAGPSARAGGTEQP